MDYIENLNLSTYIAILFILKCKFVQKCDKKVDVKLFGSFISKPVIDSLRSMN